MLIGDPDNAVVFDFQPGIDAGAQMLGRRGEDQRFRESRPAAGRRRAIDEAMPERGETEDRADVARRLDAGSDGDRRARTRTTRDPRRRDRRRARRGQGRFVVADHGRGRHRPGARASTSSTAWPAYAQRGADLVLVSSGAIAAGLAPLAFTRRPRDLARQQAAASVGQGLLVHRYTEEFARHGQVDRPGAAHRRRRHPAQPLPQRPAHLREAARARRRADRQRERHRRHHRDPVRRQRPARGAGRAPRARRPARAAQRRRRAVRRPARSTRQPADRGGQRRQPSSTASASAAPGLVRRRHRRHADQARGGADRHRRRHPHGAHRHGARPRRAGGGGDRHPVPPHRPAPAHAGCSGWRTPPSPRAGSCSTTAPSARSPSGVRRCCRPASPA